MKLLKFIVLIVLCWSCKKAMTPANKEEEALLKSLSSKRVKLPNGWSLTPVGRSLPLNDLPLNLIVSPSHKYLAVSNNGQSTQSITLIDAVTEKVLDDVSIPKSYLGLAFSDDEKRCTLQPEMTIKSLCILLKTRSLFRSLKSC
ncbi:hypothetical protein ACFFJX_09580 [Pseudarcicella hirudinis]|uniref:hypothetical protein n=1 Tax=Pseudarcicella hirudinis TaxID=1079859 RepID=UPI0035EB3713